MGELLTAGLLDESPQTVSGRSVGDNVTGKRSMEHDVIRSVEAPLRVSAGFRVMRGNLFDSALMKTSVISEEFTRRFLSGGAHPPNVLEARAIVFEGPEDYHERLNEPRLAIDEKCILFMRNVGPIGYPGSAEVVNMQPPDALVAAGVTHLPTVGDGRQSGTSESPSILNASPEAVAGGGLAILRTGDTVRLDLNAGTLDLVADEAEIARRWAEHTPLELVHQTPWQEIYRANVGQLEQGGCLELACKYQRIARVLPRNNH
jgi:dihydroxy-acid dehydratase